MTGNAILVRIVALFAGLAAGAAGCGGADDDAASTERAPMLGSSSSVADHQPQHRPGFIAVLTARDSAEVVAPYTTASAAIIVKLGDVVAAGQVVGRLDDRELRRDLEFARSQQRTVGAQIAQAEVDARGAEVVARREQAADAAGVSSHAEAVAAGQAFAKATAALRYVRTGAEERQVRISELEAQLQEMMLVAPIAGRIAMVYVHDGARVEQGHAVVRVISTEVFVKFAIPAEEVDAVKSGDAADVVINHRDETVAATVGHVAPELDGVAQLIIADAELVNPPADLQPGAVGWIIPRASAHRGVSSAPLTSTTTRSTEVLR